LGAISRIEIVKITFVKEKLKKNSRDRFTQDHCADTARKLPGRSDNAVKNLGTHQKKKIYIYKLLHSRSIIKDALSCIIHTKDTS